MIHIHDLMPRVSLPTADWSTVLYHLERATDQGFLIGSLIDDIETQLDKQEN